jgi:hypothetical protein
VLDLAKLISEQLRSGANHRGNTGEVAAATRRRLTDRPLALIHYGRPGPLKTTRKSCQVSLHLAAISSGR